MRNQAAGRMHSGVLATLATAALTGCIGAGGDQAGILQDVARECPHTVGSVHDLDIEKELAGWCPEKGSGDRVMFYLALKKCYQDERARRQAAKEWDLERDLQQYPWAWNAAEYTEGYLQQCLPPKHHERQYYERFLALLRGELERREETGQRPPDDPQAWVRVTHQTRSAYRQDTQTSDRAAERRSTEAAQRGHKQPPAVMPAPAPAPARAPTRAPEPTVVAVAAPEEPRATGAVIAVFDLEDARKSLLDGDADQLTEYFAVQLSAVGYKVVPRSQLRERLSAEKKESYNACFDESCQIDLGKAVAAQKSVATKLLKVGNTCAITATLFDLRSETAELAASVDTRCGQEELFGGLRDLARKLGSGH